MNFTTQEICTSLVITWNLVPDDPCPITGYRIDVGDSTVSRAAGVTSFNYTFGGDSCERTYPISVYAINAAGIGSKTVANQTITCTRKGLPKV